MLLKTGLKGGAARGIAPRRLLFAGLLALAALALRPAPLSAETRVKTIEYNLGGYYSVTALATKTQYNFPTRKIFLPESGATVLSAWLDYEGMTVSNTNMSGLILYFDAGTAASTARFTSGTYTARNSESIRVFAKADVTSVVAAQLAGLASGVDFTGGVYVNGPTSNGHSMKLYITYSYDDSSPTQIKTVRFPVYSNYSSLIAASTAQLLAGATVALQYNAQIAETSNVSIKQQWFEFTGFKQSSAAVTASQIFARIGAGANEPSMTLDGSLGDSYDFRYLSSSTIVPGFSTNTLQTVNLNTTRHPVNTLSGEVVLTYTFPVSAPVKTKTVRYFMGQDTLAANTTTFNLPLYIGEEGVTIREIYERITGSYNSASTAGLAVDASVGGNQLPQRTYPVLSMALQASGYRFLHSLTGGAASWSDGGVIGTTITALASGGAHGAELYVTYDYTNGAGHTASYEVLAGSMTASATTAYSSSFTYTFSEGSGLRTVRSAYLAAILFSNAATANFTDTLSLSSQRAAVINNRTAAINTMLFPYYEDKAAVDPSLGADLVGATYQTSVASVRGGHAVLTYTHIPPPKLPDSLAQKNGATGAAVAPGSFISATTLRFEGLVASSRTADNLALVVEVKPEGTPFDGTGLSTGAFTGSVGAAVSTHVVVGSLASNPYHWRAAVLGLGGRGPWKDFGGARDFGVDVSSPSAPDIAGITPSSGAYVSTGTQTLTWGASSDAGSGVARYELQVSTLSDFSVLAFSSQPAAALAVSSAPAMGAQGDKKFYWRVRAVDNVGWTGPYFSTVTFIVDTTPPADPSGAAVTPSSGVYVATGTQNLAWGASADAGSGLAYYEVQVSTASDFSALAFSSRPFTPSAVSSAPAVGAQGDKTFYWRARAVDNVGWASQYFSTVTFTVDQTSPTVPSIASISPSSGAYVSTGTQTLTWGASSDAGSGVARYEVQVSTLSNFSVVLFSSQPAAALAVSSAPALGAQGEKKFYWRARAVDNLGWASAYFSTVTFIVDLTSPTVPGVAGIVPASASFLNSSTQTLTWGASSDAGSGVARYELQVSTLSDFSVLAFSSQPAAALAVTSGPAMAQEKTFYWRVRAVDGVGWAGPYFSTATFRLDLTTPSLDNSGMAGGDQAWRSANDGSYLTSFSDLGGSHISRIQVKASSGPAQTGTVFADWTDAAAGVNADSYPGPWSLPAGVWTALQSWTTNYLSVRVVDYSSNSFTLDDAFVVLKDTSPPAAVTTLDAAKGPILNSVLLQWNAPADVGPSGTGGNGQGYYLLKMSTFAMNTDALFNFATAYVQALVPVSAGLQEALTIENLVLGTTYFFAVKSYDNAGNVSALSNSTSTLPQTGGLLINEVYPSGTGAANDWIELYNNGQQAVALTNWILVYDQGSIDLPGTETTIWTGGAADSIPVNSTFTITPSVDLNGSQSWHVILKDDKTPAGKKLTIDRVQWPVLTAGQSFARISDGNGKYLEIDPTPTKGLPNSVSTETVKLNEIAYGDPADEFIELYNTSAVSTPTLAGYYLRNSNNVPFRFTRKVYPNSYTLLDNSSVSGDAVPYAAAFGAAGLNAAGDFLALENSKGQTIDKLVWQSGAAYSRYNFKAQLVSSGDPAPANAAASIGRGPSEGADTDNNSVDWGVQTSSTPVSRNNGAGTAAANVLGYPAEGQVLPRRFKLALKLGAASSGGVNTLTFSRTGGQADPASPHIYRLQDIGLSPASLADQATAQAGLSFADQDGYPLVSTAAYLLTFNSGTGAVSAPPLTRRVIYDGSVHAATGSVTTLLRLNNAARGAAVRLDVGNSSPQGFNSVELATVAFRLMDSALSGPLTAAQAKHLFNALMLVREASGAGLAGVYEPLIDVSTIAYVPMASISLDALGFSTLTVTAPDAAAASVPAASTATFYLVFESTQDASAWTPNSFRVRFGPQGALKLRDGPSDLEEEFVPSSQLDTPAVTIIAPAQPPAGSSWPYVTPSSASIRAAVTVYSGGLLASTRAYVPSADGKLRAVARDGTLIWTFVPPDSAPISLSPSLPQEEGGSVYVYFANDGGFVYKVRDNGASSSQVWEKDLSPVQLRSLTDLGSRLFLGAGNSRVYCLNKADGAECTGWTYASAITAPVAGTPSIDDRSSILTGWVGLEDGTLVSLKTGDGSSNTTFTPPQSGGAIKSSPYLDAYAEDLNNLLYVTSTNGWIYAVNSGNMGAATGWNNFGTGSSIYTSPFVWSLGGVKYVFFGADDGKLYKLNAATGALQWTFQAGGAIRSSPVVVPAGYIAGETGDYVYFGCDDGNIYAVDANTGLSKGPAWPVATGGAVRSDPVVDNDNKMLLVGSSDGRVYSIDIKP